MADVMRRLLCLVGLHRWKNVWRTYDTERLVFWSICGPIYGKKQLVGRRCRRCAKRVEP